MLPSPQVLREDADFILRNAHKSIAPYAAARIQKAADFITRQQEQIGRLEEALKRIEFQAGKWGFPPIVDMARAALNGGSNE
jgi:hypothetical protein